MDKIKNEVVGLAREFLNDNEAKDLGKTYKILRPYTLKAQLRMLSWLESRVLYDHQKSLDQQNDVASKSASSP